MKRRQQVIYLIAGMLGVLIIETMMINSKLDEIIENYWDDEE